MVINFIKIKLHNFMSFADAELDLNEMGNILVTGRNYCKLDNAYSNGSGKSSIFNGICYALTGETSQGISSGIENIFTNPDDCWVELTFEADGDLFKIRRISTPKSDMKLYINGVDRSGKGIRESSKLLATYLPDLTSELISSAIILGQGLPYRFSNNKPSHRKELLEKLTKSDFMIQSIKDKLEIRQEDLRQSLRNKEDGLLSNTSQIEVYKSQLKGITGDLSADEYVLEEGFEGRVCDLETHLDYLYDVIAEKEDELEHYEGVVADLHKDQSAIILINKEKVDFQVNGFNSIIQPYKDKQTELLIKSNTLDREIKKLDSITDICPTCGQKLPDVVKIDTTDKKKEYSDLISELEDINIKVSQSEEIHNFTLDKLKEELDQDLKDLEDDITAQTNKITEIKTYLSNLNKEVNETNEKLYKVRSLKENYDRLIKDKATIEAKLVELDQKDIELNSDIVNIKAHLEVVQQMITLAKREFRGILLSNIIEFINKKVKQYSLAVFGTTELNFALNENCIDITYNDKMYENMSGGEKQKIDIIIQLALRDILSKQLNIHTNLLICDEIYDNMDGISCQKITNLISTLTDISSIFIISHHAQDLEITYDSNLLVEKDENGISSISFV